MRTVTYCDGAALTNLPIFINVSHKSYIHEHFINIMKIDFAPRSETQTPATIQPSISL